MSKKATQKSHRLTWPNVGKATDLDLELLGIHRLDQLKGRSPRELNRELERRRGEKMDPCCIDVFASLVWFAETGEAKAWWEFTQGRKRGEDPIQPRAPLN